MSKPTWISTSDGEPLTDRQTAGLLEMCVSHSRRPVDHLIDRLHEPDGPEWWQRAIESNCTAVCGPNPDDLLEGRATLDQLTAFIKSCSQRAKSAMNLETKLLAAAGYFVAVAAGLAYHETLICSRSRDELAPILRELAEITPKAWASLLRSASDKRQE